VERPALPNGPDAQLQRAMSMRRIVNPSAARVPFVLLLLFAFACEREIAVSDLPGIWTLTRDSRERLPAELRAGAGSLVLDSNGTFAAREIPGEIFDQGPRVITGTGRWLMNRRGLRLDLLVVANTHPSNVPFSTHFRASGTTLRYFLGDPDDFNTIEFHKVGK
jgi:hypothetical protein